MKRNRVVLATAGLVLGAAVLAWGGGAQERPTILTAAHPGAPGSAGAQAPDDQERRARRAALRTCLQQAGEDRPARRACFARAGAGAGAGADSKRHRRPGGLHHGLPGALGRAVHGTVIVPNGTGGFEEVTFDRGRVDAATDAGRIVLDRPDGPEVTVALTPDTKYHGIEDSGTLVDGRPALVVSRDGKALHVVQKVARPVGEGGKHGGNNRAAPVVPND